MNFNKAIIVGRLTANPEIRALPNGQQVATFSLATNSFYNDKEGQRQKQVEFHNIVFFGKIADIVSQYLKKGSLALIEGRIQTKSWQDKESGIKKYKTEIVGNSLQLGPKNSNQQEDNSGIQKEEIPIIQKDEEEIDIKDIPF